MNGEAVGHKTSSIEKSPLARAASTVACQRQVRKGVPLMFTRVVECTIKKGKTQEYSNSIRDGVLPILKTQPGFRDEVILVSDSEPERVLALSFWNTKQDAERYNREQYPKILDLIQSVLETDPEVQTFEVEMSTFDDVMRRKAA
jgi:heme-degrading monooxygenase HmoA